MKNYIKDNYINVRLNSHTLAIYPIRNYIFNALRNASKDFSGILVDLGCGDSPYREYLVKNTRIEKYIGIDLKNDYYTQSFIDIHWDGIKIPLSDNTVRVVVATELLEHVDKPQDILSEIYRVLELSGKVFITTPFFWPLHVTPDDKQRLTPYSLELYLRKAGFRDIEINKMGGWNSSLAQFIGLWYVSLSANFTIRLILKIFLIPVIWFLLRIDKYHKDFSEGDMTIGFSVTCRK